MSAAAPRTARTPVFVATFAALLATIAALLFLDIFLARIDSDASRAHAESEYRDGIALLDSGRPRPAIDHFIAAVAAERSNLNYALALAQAKLDAGEIADAEADATALLERSENDGAINLLMAHIMTRERRIDDAQAYYHRALFGRWGADSVQRRSAARFELIDLLATTGRPRALLAELLPLEETPPDSVALRKRLGRLFILARSPTRAADMFRELLRQNPRDADAYAGMGEAALALGNLQTARADLAQAVNLAPRDSSLAARLAFADTLIALDPTARGIGAEDRYARARAVLERTAAAVTARCGALPAALNDSVTAELAQRVTPAQSSHAADAVLDLASTIWDVRSAACMNAWPPDDVIALLHARLDR